MTAENESCADIVRSLLKTSQIKEEDEASREQERICSEILNRLQQGESCNSTSGESGQQDTEYDKDNHSSTFLRTTLRRSEENSNQGVQSVREVLGNLSSVSISEFVTLLADMMQDRVDVQQLLPQTQDVASNEQALTSNAITLTRLSFLSAKIYVTFIGMPGGWGAGVVQMGALSSLSAFLRRWNLECCGSISTRNAALCSSNEAKKRKAGSNSQGALKKRNRIANTTLSEEEKLSGGDDPSSPRLSGQTDRTETALLQAEESCELLKASHLAVFGIDVVSRMPRILLLRDIGFWTDEAREITIDSIMLSLTTVCGMKEASKAGSATNDLILEFKEALQRCVHRELIEKDVECDDDEDFDHPGGQEKREIVLYILRGLFPSLSFQVEVPNGSRGKEYAQKVAGEALVRLAGAISDSLSVKSSKVIHQQSRSQVMKTPGAKTPSYQLLSIGTTPKTGRRKKRVSFGTVGGTLVEKIGRPALKANATPLRARLSARKEDIEICQAQNANPELTAIIGLLQRLATMKSLERATTRKTIVDSICTCLTALPSSACDDFLAFEIHLCHSKIPVHRLMAVELIGTTLATTWFWEEHFESIFSPIVTDKRTSPMMTSLDANIPKAILQTLCGRLTDKTPAVRARAAYVLAETIREIVNDQEDKARSRPSLALEGVIGRVLGEVRKRAAYDDRATVRKAAIVAMEELLLFVSGTTKSTASICPHDVQLLGQLCVNESLTTRRAAAGALSRLLQQQSALQQTVRSQSYLLLEQSWASCVLPLVMDMEPSCVKSAVDWFISIVIEPLIQSEDDTLEQKTAWRILSSIDMDTCQEGASKTGFTALKEAIRKSFEVLEDRTVFALYCKIEDSIEKHQPDRPDEGTMDVVQGAWCFLRGSADQSKPLQAFVKWMKKAYSGFIFLKTSWNKMLTAFHQTSNLEGMSAVPPLMSCMRSCLLMISKMAGTISIEGTSYLQLELKDLLFSLTLGPEMLCSVIDALFTLSTTLQQNGSSEEPSLGWIKTMYSECEQVISSAVMAGGGSQNEDRLVRALFVAGELSMIGFQFDEDQIKMRKRQTVSDQVVVQKPTKKLISLVQSMLASNLPSEIGEHLSTPKPVRAHAFVTLGKFCLRDEVLAKESITVLARELHQNLETREGNVQSNALLVMGDLCVKYTNLVDRYLPVMAACLQAGTTKEAYESNFLLHSVNNSEASLVRKHAVLMLSSLLMQDYIKWRGLMFQRFLISSVDSDPFVSQLAETMLTGPLLSKYPKLFFNNFVESIFVLNRCTAHPIHRAAEASGDNGAGITVGFDGIDLRGSSGREKRMEAYKLMLENVSDEEKLGITARLAKDILGAAVDTSGALGQICRKNMNHNDKGSSLDEVDTSAFAVMSDTFNILNSPSMRVERSHEILDADDIDALDQSSKKSVVTAKGKLLSTLSRKHMIEIVLPILCNLKKILQDSCSSLLKDLMNYMTEIFRVYKKEVKEFLANDPTLLQELEYDARYFKRRQRLVKARNHAEEPSTTPSGRDLMTALLSPPSK